MIERKRHTTMKKVNAMLAKQKIAKMNEAAQPLPSLGKDPVVKAKIAAGKAAGWSYLGILVINRNRICKRGEWRVTPYCLPASMHEKNLTASLTNEYVCYKEINGEKKEIPVWVKISVENNKPVEGYWSCVTKDDLWKNCEETRGHKEWYYARDYFANKGLSEKVQKISESAAMAWSQDYKYFYFIDLRKDPHGVLDDYIQSRRELGTYNERLEELKRKREEERKEQARREKEYWEAEKKRREEEEEKRKKKQEEYNRTHHWLNLGNGADVDSESYKKDRAIWDACKAKGGEVTVTNLGRCYNKYTINDPETGHYYSFTVDSSD